MRIHGLLDRAHQLDRDRILVPHQLAALELTDAVLGTEAAAIARDQVVYAAIDRRCESEKFPVVGAALPGAAPQSLWRRS